MSKDKVSIFFMVVMLVMAASMAFGATKPMGGEFAYDAYDIGVNKIIGGPPGYLISAAGVAFGATMIAFTGAVKLGIMALVGSGLFLGVNGIVGTMGILY